MKVLYVLRSIAHFPYHESVIGHLLENGHQVDLLLDRGWSQGFSHRALQSYLAGTKGLTVDWLIRRADGWRRLLFASRELLTYSSYLNRKNQSAYYMRRWESYLPPFIRLLVQFAPIRALTGSALTQSLLRAFERWIPPDAGILRWLISRRPDVAVVSPTNMRFSEEVEYLKAAKALGIPTVVPVLSWDNLTTKGLFHVIADLTLVWNQAQFEEATRIHRVPSDSIVIIGSPFFDKWFGPEQLKMEKDAFYRAVGLPPGSAFVAYLGSSANIARDETWLVRQLAAGLRRHPDPRIRTMKLLCRPHPANARFYANLDDQENVRIWPREGALPDSEDSQRGFYNTMFYSVATIAVNTSGMIDAVINDKPCITVLTERYEATQSRVQHFRYLLESDALHVARSPDEALKFVERIWEGSDSKEESRRRFVRRFIRPRGLRRPAGKVAALAVEQAASGGSAVQIDTRIRSADLPTVMVNQ